MRKKDIAIAIVGLVVALGLIALVFAMPNNKTNTSDNTHDTTNVEGHNNSSSDKGGQ